MSETKKFIKVASGEQADGYSRRSKGYHQFIKKAKIRKERRRANEAPECIPGYGKYNGYET